MCYNTGIVHYNYNYKENMICQVDVKGAIQF